MRFVKILRDQRGVAAIELALIAPVLATLIVGVVDVTTAFNRKLELEQGVQRAIERVMQTTIEDTVENNIKQEVAAATGISQDKVIVTYSLTCNGTIKAYDDDCTSGQAEVRYLSVRASDTFNPMFLVPSIGFGGPMTLTAETGMRTQ